MIDTQPCSTAWKSVPSPASAAGPAATPSSMLTGRRTRCTHITLEPPWSPSSTALWSAVVAPIPAVLAPLFSRPGAGVNQLPKPAAPTTAIAATWAATIAWAAGRLAALCGQSPSGHLQRQHLRIRSHPPRHHGSGWGQQRAGRAYTACNWLCRPASTPADVTAAVCSLAHPRLPLSQWRLLCLRPGDRRQDPRNPHHILLDRSRHCLRGGCGAV